jgi:hypothetical protein
MIADALAARFGRYNVFYASDTIRAGDSFPPAIIDWLTECDALLVVIGDRWLQPKLDDPHDWVRREIEFALTHGKRVIPIRLDNTPRLDRALLPPEIADLALLQDRPLRHRNGDYDFARLIDTLVDLYPELDTPSTIASPELDTVARHLVLEQSGQWSREAENRLAKPPLRVRWHTSSSSGGLDELVDMYHGRPLNRVAVLGRAGSGKTVLAMRLTLALLKRADPDVVPVIFGLASWHPGTRSLRDWLADELIRDHPGLAVRGPLGSTIAAALVDSGRILPILDGFDEIATGLQRDAMFELNQTDLPWLLTSREDEYNNATKAQHVLELRLDDLTSEELTKYLAGDKWRPVLDHLDGPVGTTLRTPLMASLARSVYQDGNPAELFDDLADADTISGHLFEEFVPAVYRGEQRWRADQVQHWLGFLADHLTKLDTVNLMWWQLGSTLPRPIRALVVGLGVAVAVALPFAFFLTNLRGAIVCGLFCGLFATLSAGLGHNRVVTMTIWLLGTVSLTLLALSSYGMGLASAPIIGAFVALYLVLLYRVSGGAEPVPSRLRFLRPTWRGDPRRKALFAVLGGLFGAAAFAYLHVFTPWMGLAEDEGAGWQILAGACVGMTLGLLLGAAVDFKPRFSRRAFLVGVVLAAAAYPAVNLVLAVPPRQILIRTPLIVLASGLVNSAVWRHKGSFSTARIRQAKVLRFGYSGMALGAVAGGAVIAVSGHFDVRSPMGIIVGAAIGTVAGIAAGVIAGAANMIGAADRQIDVEVSVSTSDLLIVDGWNAIVYAVLYAVPVGLMAWVLARDPWSGIVVGLAVGITAGVAGRAWGRWLVLARFWLPLTGRLPWRVNTFLKDAHRRGVLRQAGAVYQFRHLRLREHLANSYRSAADAAEESPAGVPNH